MRLRPPAFAVLLLWIAAAAAGAAAPPPAPPGWQEIVIPAGGFRVLMPGSPRTSRQTLRTEIGDVVATRYTVTDAAGVTYDVLFNDYPAAGVARANPHKLLDGARDGLVYQTRGRLLSDRPMTLAGHPGRDQELLGPDGKHYRVRLVWAGTRLYQVMAVSPDKPRPEASTFFESFRLTTR